MTEKYSLLPINPQQLTPAQMDLQKMSEKHLDFEIQAVNTIRPPDIEYTKTSQPLVKYSIHWVNTALERLRPTYWTLKKWKNRWCGSIIDEYFYLVWDMINFCNGLLITRKIHCM